MQVFVEPSEEAMLLLSWAPGWLGQSPDAPATLSHGLRNLLVAPLTQFTFLSFNLQYFLFQVFHRTWLARVSHLVGMALLNLFLMAGLSQLTAGSATWPWGGLDGGALYATALLSWYAAISRDARLPLWWLAMVPVVGGLYLASRAFLVADPLGLSPWLLVLASAAFISLSHVSEPFLPPRAGDPQRWVPVRAFVLGPPQALHPPGQILRRALRVFAFLCFGLLQELWAAPRLLPYTILDLLFSLGYAPRRRDALMALTQRAIDSGNPALDFVGIGGGTPLALSPIPPGPAGGTATSP